MLQKPVLITIKNMSFRDIWLCSSLSEKITRYPAAFLSGCRRLLGQLMWCEQAGTVLQQ